MRTLSFAPDIFPWGSYSLPNVIDRAPWKPREGEKQVTKLYVLSLILHRLCQPEKVLPTSSQPFQPEPGLWASLWCQDASTQWPALLGCSPSPSLHSHMHSVAKLRNPAWFSSLPFRQIPLWYNFWSHDLHISLHSLQEGKKYVELTQLWIYRKGGHTLPPNKFHKTRLFKTVPSKWKKHLRC